MIASAEDVARGPGWLTARLTDAAADAACAGHFPGDPIIPGSRLAGFAAEVAARVLGPGWRLVGMERATFLRPVRPTVPVALHARGADGRVAVEIRTEAATCARLAFRFEASS